MTPAHPPSITRVSGRAQSADHTMVISCVTDGPLPNRGTLRITLTLAQPGHDPDYVVSVDFDVDGRGDVELWSRSSASTIHLHTDDVRITTAPRRLTFELPLDAFEWTFPYADLRVTAAFSGSDLSSSAAVGDFRID